MLFDSSDRLPKAFTQKGELALAIWLKRGPAYLARNDVRDLVLGPIQAGWFAHWSLDYPDGFFYVAWDLKLLQNTCGIAQSAVVNTFQYSGSVEPRAVAIPVQARFALLKSIQRTCLDQCQFGTPWRKRTAVLSSHIDTHPLARIWTSQKVCSWSHRPQVHLGSVLLYQKSYVGLRPASFKMPIVPSKP